jgi:hypothetical protein
MADESQNSIPSAAHVATPQTDPTPAQVESRSVVSNLTKDIDDLWAKAEGRAPADEAPAPAETAVPETPAEAATRTRDANGRFQKAEAQAPAETPAANPAAEAISASPETTDEAPAPVLDREAIIREERARIEAEAAERERVRKQIEAEQQHRQTYEAYIGADDDYQAVQMALRACQRGDASALNRLDVLLPNGKRVSQVHAESQTGLSGLTESEAASLLDTWDANRGYEDVMGTKKVQQVLAYWDAQTVAALRSPDVDAQKVRSFSTPGEQMQAAIDTTRESVERRLSEKHAAELKAKDAEIEARDQRIQSLTTERTTLRSGQRAAEVASPDRPGQPGSLRTGLPSIEELRQMSPDEFFKSGVNDRLLQSIPGGMQRRRTG